MAYLLMLLIFYSSGSCLSIVDRVIHLGHYLRYDVSDVDDIVRAAHSLVKKVNLMLITFSAANPLDTSRRLQSFCLSLYGCSLWNCECPSIRSIEVSFNNILRRILHLPRNCHTGIPHLTAQLPSMFNTVVSRSTSLLRSALCCSSFIVSSVFGKASQLVYTSTGYNGHCHIKEYFHQYGLRASVLRHLRMNASFSDPDINDMVYIISTS